MRIVHILYLAFYGVEFCLFSGKRFLFALTQCVVGFQRIVYFGFDAGQILRRNGNADCPGIRLQRSLYSPIVLKVIYRRLLIRGQVDVPLSVHDYITGQGVGPGIDRAPRWRIVPAFEGVTLPGGIRRSANQGSLILRNDRHVRTAEAGKGDGVLGLIRVSAVVEIRTSGQR